MLKKTIPYIDLNGVERKEDELQAMLHKVIHHEKPPPTASFDF